MEIRPIDTACLVPHKSWVKALPKPTAAMLDVARSAGMEALPLIHAQVLSGTDFEILSGIRTWRVAGLLQIHNLPVCIDSLPKAKALAMMELDYSETGTHRAGDPITLAQKIASLVNNKKLSIAAAGREFEMKPAHTANHLRLLKLPEYVQKHIREGRIAVGYAKIMVNLPAVYMKEAVSLLLSEHQERPSVREFEAWVKLRREGRLPAKPQQIKPDWAPRYEQRLKEIFGAQVEINDAGAAGSIVMHYTSHDELDGILNKYRRLGFSPE